MVTFLRELASHCNSEAIVAAHFPINRKMGWLQRR